MHVMRVAKQVYKLELFAQRTYLRNASSTAPTSSKLGWYSGPCRCRPITMQALKSFAAIGLPTLAKGRAAVRTALRVPTRPMHDVRPPP